jgi:hypothetical protein
VGGFRVQIKRSVQLWHVDLLPICSSQYLLLSLAFIRWPYVQHGLLFTCKTKCMCVIIWSLHNNLGLDDNPTELLLHICGSFVSTSMSSQGHIPAHHMLKEFTVILLLALRSYDPTQTSSIHGCVVL